MILNVSLEWAITFVPHLGRILSVKTLGVQVLLKCGLGSELGPRLGPGKG